MSPDPKNSAKEASPQSWNRYAYASNNPLKFVDPDGQESLAALRLEMDIQRVASGEMSAIEFQERNKARASGAFAAVSLFIPGPEDVALGFRALLSGRGARNKMLRITFEGLVAYRNINESYRLRSLPSGEPWTLFRVEGSSWISWICEESGGVLIPEQLLHFAILTPEDFLDVVTQYEPTVEWLTD